MASFETKLAVKTGESNTYEVGVGEYYVFVSILSTGTEYVVTLYNMANNKAQTGIAKCYDEDGRELEYDSVWFDDKFGVRFDLKENRIGFTIVE